METSYNIVGQIAGGVSLCAYLIYCYTTVYGHTRPNRATWGILTFIGGMVAASYYAVGATDTMWLPVSYFLGPGIVFILSFKFGEGGWSFLDRMCVSGALLGAVLWWFFDSPLVALIVNLGMDFLGLVPTIKKSYLRPDGEDRIAWLIESFASVLNIFAIAQWKFVIWVQPVYLVIINVFITFLLFRSKKKGVNF